MKIIKAIFQVREPYALFLIIKNSALSWRHRLIAALIILFSIAYFINPLDIIPDTIPFAGLIDDLLLIPTGLYLVERLIPAPVLAESREKARVKFNGALLKIILFCFGLIALWLFLLAAGVLLITNLIRG